MAVLGLPTAVSRFEQMGLNLCLNLMYVRKSLQARISLLATVLIFKHVRFKTVRPQKYNDFGFISNHQ